MKLSAISGVTIWDRDPQIIWTSGGSEVGSFRRCTERKAPSLSFGW